MHHLGQIHRLALDGQLAGANLGHVEEIAHQPRQPPGLAHAHDDVLRQARSIDRRRVGRQLRHLLESHLERGQRRVELVRRDRDELVADAQRLFGGDARLLLAHQQFGQLLLGALALGDVADGGDAHQPPVMMGLPAAQLADEGRAVLAQPERLVGVLVALLDALAHQRARGDRGQLERALAEELAGLVAEHRRQTAVGVDDAAVLVDGDALEAGLGERAIALLGLDQLGFAPPPFGDVGGEDERAAQLAGVVAQRLPLQREPRAEELADRGHGLSAERAPRFVDEPGDVGEDLEQGRADHVARGAPERQQAAPFEDRDDAVAIEGEVGDGTVRQEMLLALRRHAEDPTPM